MKKTLLTIQFSRYIKTSNRVKHKTPRNSTKQEIHNCCQFRQILLLHMDWSVYVYVLLVPGDAITPDLKRASKGTKGQFDCALKRAHHSVNDCTVSLVSHWYVANKYARTYFWCSGDTLGRNSRLKCCILQGFYSLIMVRWSQNCFDVHIYKVFCWNVQ